MKATSSQLKSFLRTCKNAYVTVDIGNGPMMVKVIKSALSEAISTEEYAESMWHYEFMQTDSGLDLRLGEQVTAEAYDDSNLSNSLKDEDYYHDYHLGKEYHE